MSSSAFSLRLPLYEGTYQSSLTMIYTKPTLLIKMLVAYRILHNLISFRYKSHLVAHVKGPIRKERE